MAQTRRVVLAVLIALAAIALATTLDRSIAQTMRENGAESFLHQHHRLRDALKAPGWFGLTIVVAVIVSLVHRARWRAGLFVILTTVSAALNQVIKWMVGRTRPYKIDGFGSRLAPFELHPFHSAKNLCFPSGHATLAFATAAALGMLWPRLRWLWYILASVVAIERIAENAHWFSDAVAGAALGIGGAYFVAWLLKKWKINLLTSRS
jgi:membrane-associated phospholipid phosphatase